MRGFLRNPVPIITVAGVASFGIFRGAYEQFYGQFNLSPEDVGLGYSDILARSALGAIVGAAGLLLLVLAVLGAMVAFGLINYMVSGIFGILPVLLFPKRAFEPGRLRRRWLNLLSLPAPPRDLDRQRPTVRLRRSARYYYVEVPKAYWRRALAWRLPDRAAAPLVVLTLVSLFVLYIPSEVRHRVTQVKAGEAAGPVRAFGLPLLGVGVDHVEVAWSGEPPAAGPDLAARTCLMYLGQSDGTTALFDAATGELIRVPSGAAIVIHRPTGICKEPEFTITPDRGPLDTTFTLTLPLGQLALGCWEFDLVRAEALGRGRQELRTGRALLIHFTPTERGTHLIKVRFRDPCANQSSSFTQGAVVVE